MSVGHPLLSFSKLSLLQFTVNNYNFSINTCSDTHLETGGSLWHASYALAHYFTKHPEIVKGKIILELGAGCGLCGIAASKLGASKVILTDMECQLSHLRNNVLSNEVNNTFCISLPFGATRADYYNNLLQLLGHAVSESDWEPDIIIATDVCYDISLHEPIVSTLRSIMSSRTVVYLTEEGMCVSSMCVIRNL